MVQILAVHDLASAQTRSLEHRDELLQTAATIDPLLSRFGGGSRGIEVRRMPSGTCPITGTMRAANPVLQPGGGSMRLSQGGNRLYKPEIEPTNEILGNLSSLSVRLPAP